MGRIDMPEVNRPSDSNEEIQAMLGDLEFYLKVHNNLPVEKAPKNKLDDCKHTKVIVDEENHTVTCRRCGKVLDPFWYLCLLAKEWSFRRYEDAEAIKAYRALKQRDLNDEAKGKIISRPDSGEAQEVWDNATKWLGHEPNYIWKQGRREWMVNDQKMIDGVLHSTNEGYSWIMMRLAGKRL